MDGRNAGTLGLAGPRPQDPWPADLIEAMGDEYGDSAYTAYAVPKRPVCYVGHHYGWTFATLEGAPTSVGPSLGRAPTPSSPTRSNDTAGVPMGASARKSD